MSISGSAGKALFSGGRYNGTLENYIYRVLQELAGEQVRLAVGPVQRTMINGIPAAYTTARANTSSGAIDVSVFAYQWSAEHGLPLRDADPRRNGHRSVRADGAVDPPDHAGRSRGDPPASHRCA